MVEYAFYIKKGEDSVRQFELEKDGRTILSLAGSCGGELSEKVLASLPQTSEPQIRIKLDGSLYAQAVKTIKDLFQYNPTNSSPQE